MKRTALITGASGGLGLEFARLCAIDGDDLVLVARSKGKLDAIAEELSSKYGVQVTLFPCDLSAKDAALEVYEYTQSKGLNVDILINNAGFGDAGPFAYSDWKKQYNMVQLNITALMQMTHIFIKPMLERGYGKILNMSSVAAFSAGPDMSIYYASKEFVRSFSEAVAEEVKGNGVTVTAFCPGPTATGFEKAASMESKSTMFKHAASADQVASVGYAAMMKGKVLSYCGMLVKTANIGSRLLPRSISRKCARYMNKL